GMRIHSQEGARDLPPFSDVNPVGNAHGR
ncbi:MAG: NAD(FAD)-dependent dehydrogenase, partial [Caballeronia sp.]|nr:NAD(FAD)-dependent dehydrogenase [Caballeronia sp.]